MQNREVHVSVFKCACVTQRYLINFPVSNTRAHMPTKASQKFNCDKNMISVIVLENNMLLQDVLLRRLC